MHHAKTPKHNIPCHRVLTGGCTLQEYKEGNKKQQYNLYRGSAQYNTQYKIRLEKKYNKVILRVLSRSTRMHLQVNSSRKANILNFKSWFPKLPPHLPGINAFLPGGRSVQSTTNSSKVLTSSHIIGQKGAQYKAV
jgi:hypothetical protein